MNKFLLELGQIAERYGILGFIAVFEFFLAALFLLLQTGMQIIEGWAQLHGVHRFAVQGLNVITSSAFLLYAFNHLYHYSQGPLGHLSRWLALKLGVRSASDKVQ